LYLLVSPPWMAVMSELQEHIQTMQSSPSLSSRVPDFALPPTSLWSSRRERGSWSAPL
jgi:hypothetical protein